MFFKCFCFFLTVSAVLDLDESFILVAYGRSVRWVTFRAPQNQPQFLLLLMNRIIHQLQQARFFRLTWGPKHGDQSLNKENASTFFLLFKKQQLTKAWPPFWTKAYVTWMFMFILLIYHFFVHSSFQLIVHLLSCISSIPHSSLKVPSLAYFIWIWPNNGEFLFICFFCHSFLLL